MIRVLIFGVTGYTGIELVRLLAAHSRVTIAAASSRNWAGKRAVDVFPFLSQDKDFPILSMEELASQAEGDLAFLALPHGESARAIRGLLSKGLKVVDLSADCRISEAEVYARWYGPHPDPGLLPRAVYGLPEIHRDRIRTSDLAANPGCYPTTVILAAAPLIGVPEVDTSCPVVDSKSGISGAGRGAKLTTSFCEAGEGFKPYGVTGHRHIPEMEQELSLLAGKEVKVRFTPHLIPTSRGMVTTMHLPLKGGMSADHLREAYLDYYRGEPFIRVLPPGVFPDTLHVRGSNQCHLAVEVDHRTGWVIAMAALDNLVKGASGAAIQNMNLMMGFEETEGLNGLPLFP